MKLLIKNGHVVDPSQKIDTLCDILIEGGKVSDIIRVRPGSAERKDGKSRKEHAGVKTLDAKGLVIMPGFVDMHVHLREPGYEYKETIQTGTEAAVRGGFTSVCCMPNTNPANDVASVTQFIIRKAIQVGSAGVFPVGAITKGQKGVELAELTLMREAGCVAFSDDGRPVADSLMMRRALEYSRGLDVPLISHCEDLSLSDGGSMNEGFLSVSLGLKGIPVQAEEIMVARDIALAELTGGRLHIAHVSAAESVSLIRAAKKRGIAAITAETCPHYFSITEEAVLNYNTNAKVNPPLRLLKDIEAVKEGLADGTIDVIATDHAPHHTDEKLLEFDRAPSGISGLETAAGLCLKLVEQKVLSMKQLVEKMALNPSAILKLQKGSLKKGYDADIVMIDPKKEYRVDPAGFRSKGKNSPFEGWLLTGIPVFTIARGKLYSWH